MIIDNAAFLSFCTYTSMIYAKSD